MNAEGRVYNTLDILDFGTRYSFYVLLPSKVPDGVAEKFVVHWVYWVGPLERVVHDFGTEFVKTKRLPCYVGALE